MRFGLLPILFLRSRLLLSGLFLSGTMIGGCTSVRTLAAGDLVPITQSINAYCHDASLGASWRATFYDSAGVTFPTLITLAGANTNASGTLMLAWMDVESMRPIDSEGRQGPSYFTDKQFWLDHKLGSLSKALIAK